MRKTPWQDTDSVLQIFGKNRYAARKKYRDFVEKGIGQERNPKMTGRGVLRSIGGWDALKSMRKMKIHVKGDERILGDSVLAYWAVRELGLTATEVGKYLGLSKSAVSRAAARDQQLVADQSLTLED